MPSRIKHLRISTKLMLINAAILISVLLLTSFLTVVGLYVSIYHQAEVEISHSIDSSLAAIDDASKMSDDEFPPLLSQQQERDIIERNPDWVPPPRFTHIIRKHGAISPGVVLRIEDESGRIVYDNASQYPSVDEVKSGIIDNPPFWSNRNMQVAMFDNFHMYYASVEVEWRGSSYRLHFIRMITAERRFLAKLSNGLFITNSLGILLALFACYLVSKRALKPIRTITQTAQEIEVSDLSRRIPLPHAKDELLDLVVTFNHMLERIELGFARQRQFVSDASHELRTPVTVILGYSDMLSRWGREDPDTLDECISAIRSETINMRDLIENLLFLARADLHQQTQAKQNIDMHELIEDTAKKAALIAENHTVTLSSNDEASIYDDAVSIRQMLRIFIDNAIKYTPKGGHIELSSKNEGDMLHVTIADDGVGIAPEHQQKIFERFYRIDSSRTKSVARESNGKTPSEAGGTGLGLSIAKFIADARGIKINLESEPGKGTTIHLLFPLAEH